MRTQCVRFGMHPSRLQQTTCKSTTVALGRLSALCRDNIVRWPQERRGVENAIIMRAMF